MINTLISGVSVIGRELLADVTTAKGLTSSHIPPTDKNVMLAVVQAITGPIRICIDGTTAEAAVGMIIPANETFVIWGADALKNCSLIDDGATTGTVEVIYYGRK